MNIDSAFFLFGFLPILFLIYILVRKRGARCAVLTAAGLVFCAFGCLFDLLVLVLLSLATFLLGLSIMNGRGRRGALTVGVAVNALTLILFKSVEKLTVTLTGGGAAALLLFSRPSPVTLAAPIGISFFTFKCISYLVDVYRDGRNGTRKYWRFLLYATFLPQLAAGPITRFPDFAPQIYMRRFHAPGAAEGMKRFIRGLAKKLFIAAAAGSAADAVFGLDAGDLDMRLAWLGAFAYCVQLFFDFSGYSDMAIGLGQLFGFKTPENFDYPYISSSVTEFWRRWHISLSSWFRDYVYIPLGGNRRGKWRAALNKFIVFVLCGVWHGFGLTFLLWGVWHGALAALESLRVIDPKRLESSAAGRAAGRVYTLLVVAMGFVMFRAGTVGQGFAVLAAMFTGIRSTAAGNTALFTALSFRNVFFLLLGAVLSTPVCRNVAGRLRGNGFRVLTGVLYLGLFALCLTELAAGGFSPFIYARF